MGVEVRPFGVLCNIACQYCYQNPERDAGNVLNRYDLPRMQASIERANKEFTLFGGEPLLMPLDDLETLWKFGFERFGKNSVQTNGTLISDAHLELFRKYNVGVGISVDGPGELNDVRWAGSLEKTREATEKTHNAIDRLCKEYRPPSLIITLHRNNATEDKLPRMQDWIRELDAKGIGGARLHLLEVEHGSIQEKYALTPQENIDALLSFAELEKDLNKLTFDLFRDMRNMLQGRDNKSTCIWMGCDSYNTKAVQGIEGNGQQSNCGRTNKDGIDFVKSEREGFERYMALYQTPQEFGGCKDCRFFLMCKGNCPGTAIDGDWRNRSEHCEVWMRLYEELEDRLMAVGVKPLSKQPVLRERLENDFMKSWGLGKNTTMHQLLDHYNKERRRA